jgi:hypothetical protein
MIVRGARPRKMVLSGPCSARARDARPQHRRHGPLQPGGTPRARPHCRFVLSFIRFIPYSLTYSIPLFLKRQCNRTVCGCTVRGARRAVARVVRRRRGGGEHATRPPPRRVGRLVSARSVGPARVWAQSTSGRPRLNESFCPGEPAGRNERGWRLGCSFVACRLCRL